MIGSTAIIEFLERHDIHHIFYLPGIHTISLSKTLKTRNSNIFIGRHEANLLFMADGFARTSGTVGVTIVTPGPGLGNTVSGFMEAYGANVPLLVLHIDTERKDIGKGALHEIAEPETMFRSFTKKTITVWERQNLVPALDEAYHTALEPRQGPALVSIPYTFLEKEVPFHLPERRKIPVRQVVPEIPSGLDDALRDKERPVIIGGKSLMLDGAESLIGEICTTSSIPFLTTTSGKGVVNEESAWCFGNVMQQGVVGEILERADLTIAIGTRLRRVDVHRGSLKDKDLIHVDVDTEWIDRNYRATMKISGDPMQFLTRLRDVVKGKRFGWKIDDLKKDQHKERKALHKRSAGYKLVSLIRKVIPRDSITVWDPNLPAYWAESYFPAFYRRTFIMPTGISPIFYGLPAAIGAKIGKPDKPCLSVCGDGGVLPTLSELSTISRYGIPVVILVYNNNSFGVLEDYMKTGCTIEGSMFLQNPDFVKVAQAFGIKAKRTTSLRGLGNILRRDITWTEPFLIEFRYPCFPPPWRSR